MIDSLRELAEHQMRKNIATRAENRAWVKEHIPELALLFDGLAEACMEPRMVVLERFA
ncbi:MAG: hypothetical protein J0I77_17700 [Rudaea sp.]|uniref:hypothetical protein n=1 Tax=unclassified Rudaea TaxID=2627037 RepID=UPI0014854AC6|nr:MULTISPECIES: hypothetical protein [unclassified Rudaea]MBN8887563.1 hypothetical protein [Rudaea sp.]